MERVKPTSKWNSPIAVVPGQRPVRYPARPPHIVSVNTPTAKYLIDKQMATAVDGNGKEISSTTLLENRGQPQPVTGSESSQGDEEAKELQSSGEETSDGKGKDSQTEEASSESLETSDGDDGSDAESTASASNLEKEIEFIKSSTAKEISKVEMIGIGTAKKLKASAEELTPEKLREMLSDRQIESLVSHLSKE